MKISHPFSWKIFIKYPISSIWIYVLNPITVLILMPLVMILSNPFLVLPMLLFMPVGLWIQSLEYRYYDKHPEVYHAWFQAQTKR